MDTSEVIFKGRTSKTLDSEPANYLSYGSLSSEVSHKRFGNEPVKTKRALKYINKKETHLTDDSKTKSKLCVVM